LAAWIEIKKQDWLQRQAKAGVEVDMADLEQKEQLGEILPYEKEVIPDMEEIQAKVNALLRTDDTGTYVAMDAANQRPEVVDPFAKYKEHERELKRERRVKNNE
jgi:hypothetical protein